MWQGRNPILRYFALWEGFASVNFTRIKNQTIPGTVGYPNAILTGLFDILSISSI